MCLDWDKGYAWKNIKQLLLVGQRRLPEGCDSPVEMQRVNYRLYFLFFFQYFIYMIFKKPTSFYNVSWCSCQPGFIISTFKEPGSQVHRWCRALASQGRKKPSAPRERTVLSCLHLIGVKTYTIIQAFWGWGREWSWVSRPPTIPPRQCKQITSLFIYSHTSLLWYQKY